MGGVVARLVDANTTIPVTKSQIFSTAADNQPTVEINVLQGERPMSKDNKSLGRFNLDGIPPAQRGIPQIEVVFDIDTNGILSVKAIDKGTGKEQSIRIEGSSNLSDIDIEKMKEEAKANEKKDNEEKEKIDTLNKADSLIFQTEKQIKEFDDKLTDEDKTNLTESVDLLKESHKIQDIDKIKENTEKLNTQWNEISQKLYQEQTPPPPTEEPPKDDDVEDVDYEDVPDETPPK